MAEEATGVITADEQATATTESPAVENKELEVVEDGPELDPNDFSDEESTETEQEEEPSTDDESTEQADDAETDEQPREVNKKSENRFQKLANENRELKEFIKQRVYDSAQPVDIQKAVEDGTPELRAEMDAMKQQLFADRTVSQLADLNQSVNADVDMVEREYAFMDTQNADRSAEDIEVSNIVTSMWRESNNLQLDKTGSFVTAPPNVPLSEFVKNIEAIVAIRQKQSEVAGKKAAIKTLSAVEVKPSSKPKASNTDDSKLSSAEYAKKYGL